MILHGSLDNGHDLDGGDDEGYDDGFSANHEVLVYGA